MPARKIEMITRMIAETGVKELVILQVHGLLIRHQDKPAHGPPAWKLVQHQPAGMAGTH